MPPVFACVTGCYSPSARSISAVWYGAPRGQDGIHGGDAVILSGVSVHKVGGYDPLGRQKFPAVFESARLEVRRRGLWLCNHICDLEKADCSWE